MNNTKTRKHYSKYINNFFIFIFLTILSIASVLVWFPNNQTLALSIPDDKEATKRADAYCKTQDFKGGEASSCAQGYIASIQGKQVDRNKLCDGANSSTGNKNACKNGFDQGVREFKKSNPVVIAYEESERKADAYCDSRNYEKEPAIPTPDGASMPNPSEWSSCRGAYISALSTTEVNPNKVCERFLGGQLEDSCMAGFLQGLREYQLLAGIKEPASPGNNNQQGQAAGSGNPGGNQVADCDTEAQTPLSWILCPLIDLGAGTTDWIFQNVVKPLLSDTPLCRAGDQGCEKADEGAFRAWQGFRLIANIMLVGSMLMIVYAQAKGEK